MNKRKFEDENKYDTNDENEYNNDHQKSLVEHNLINKSLIRQMCYNQWQSKLKQSNQLKYALPEEAKTHTCNKQQQRCDIYRLNLKIYLFDGLVIQQEIDKQIANYKEKNIKMDNDIIPSQ